MFLLVADPHLATVEAAMDWVGLWLVAEGFMISTQNGLEESKMAQKVGAARMGQAFVDLCAWLSTQSKKRSGIWRDLAVRRHPTEVPAHYTPVLEVAERFTVPMPLTKELLVRIGQLERGEIPMDESLIRGLGNSGLGSPTGRAEHERERTDERHTPEHR